MDIEEFKNLPEEERAKELAKAFGEFCRRNEIIDAEDFVDHLTKLEMEWEIDDILNPPKPEGVCAFCGLPKTTRMNFCYGCKQYVCVDCVRGWQCPSGPHVLEDHHKNFVGYED